MRSILMIIVMAMAYLPLAYGGNGGVHAGDPCEQAIEEREEQLQSNLYFEWNSLGRSIYSEVDWAAYNWFKDRSKIKLVPEVSIGGQLKAAKSDRATRTIYLSKKLWCGLIDERAQSILFHEHLVIAEIEQSHDYHVSKQFIPYLHQARDSRRWVCQAPAYRDTYSGLDVTTYLPVGLGASAEEAFTSLNSNSVFTYPGHGQYQATLCMKVEYVGKSPVDGGDRYRCLEPAAIANSCRQQF